MKLALVSVLLSLATSLQASSFNKTSTQAAANPSPSVFKTKLTIAGLERIAPGLKDNCTNAEFQDECSTAEQALPHIIAGFKQYNIQHAAVQAAVVALMAFESGDFVYNKRHYPEIPGGYPGQGTKNMQVAGNNELYAKHLNIDPSLWNGNANKMLDLVAVDNHTFASATWYIKTQCPFKFRKDLWGGSSAAFQNYVQGCVLASWDPARLDYWDRAKKEFLPN